MMNSFLKGDKIVMKGKTLHIKDVTSPLQRFQLFVCCAY
jgi:hypothetical protein